MGKGFVVYKIIGKLIGIKITSKSYHEHKFKALCSIWKILFLYLWFAFVFVSLPQDFELLNLQYINQIFV